MARQTKVLSKEAVYNALKHFHETQRPQLAVSKANVPLFRQWMGIGEVNVIIECRGDGNKFYVNT